MKMSINLTHEQDILACVQYKPARLKPNSPS